MTRTLSKRRVALVTSFAVASGAAFAQAQPQATTAPPRYRVELIVFANLDYSAGAELFDERQAPLAVPELQVFDDDWLRAQQEAAALADGAGDAGDARAPAQADAGADGSTPPSPLVSPAQEVEPRFRLLAADELELTPQYQRLASSRNWRPILHGGWVQEVVTESRSEPVRLTALGVHNPGGTITLYRNNFLHLRLDVVYQEGLGGGFTRDAQPSDSGGVFAPGAPSFGGGFGLEPFSLAPRYRLEQSRQTRSGQLQHFDHPAFGVLVKVTEIPRAAAPSGTPQRPEP